MSRLTEKKSGYYMPTELDPSGSNYLFGSCIDKLGKLEDIEVELGCPLDVVFKALKDGFYINTELVPKEPSWECKNESYSICCAKYFRLNMWHKTIEVDRFEHYLEVYLKDYKKTWWLKQ